MYAIKSRHCPDCGKLVRYNGVWVFALLVHYRLKHIGWTSMIHNATSIRRPIKEN